MSLDFELLALLWNNFYPSKFRVDAQTVEAHVGPGEASMKGACYSVAALDLSLAHGDTDSDNAIVSRSTSRQAVVLKRSGTPSLFSGQDRDRGHLAFWAADGSSLENHGGLFDAITLAKDMGLKRLAFGMDPDHLLPGCPEEMTELRAQLRSVGFRETGRCFDLERDLDGYRLTPDCEAAICAAAATVRSCTAADISKLDEFFLREFPSRWRYDVMRKVAVDDEPEQVYILLVAGEIEGFALTQAEGCRRPIAGAVWRIDLGLRWGALGPIGISRATRGKGLGNALLGYALEGLARRGARRTIIDWTTLEDFYGAHGFRVTRRYLTMVKELDGTSVP